MENANVQDPRLHVNEEPRDDLKDLVYGFGGMFGFMFIVFTIAVIVKFIITD
ncbi:MULTISPECIES: YqzM family protein [Cohnella]|uniref:YqzM family protein n=1 Tax=Cohnella TaxID=329857 RepID=UPI00111B1C8F|nr:MULTISPECIES: YqzM family protein [Cohnella]MBN2982867.1 YqzM family protein [Cohnella algarum]